MIFETIGPIASLNTAKCLMAVYGMRAAMCSKRCAECRRLCSGTKPYPPPHVHHTLRSRARSSHCRHPGSDDGHVIDAKDLPAIPSQGIWEGELEASDPPSSPGLGPAHAHGQKGRYVDIVDLANKISHWPLADKIFGDLQERPGFPRLYDTSTVRLNISSQDWQATRQFIQDQPSLLHCLSFVYNPAMSNLTVYGPTSLHQWVNNCLAGQVGDAAVVSPSQVIRMDGARGLLTANVAHIPDAVMTVSTSKKLSPTRLIHISRDTYVNETSYTQILKKVLPQIHTTMCVKHKRGPLLFTVINLEELAYIDPDEENSQPDEDGFVAGGGMVTTSVYRLEARRPEDRADLEVCLRRFWEKKDWQIWNYCVPVQHRYIAGSTVAELHDHVVNKTNDAPLIHRLENEARDTPNFSLPAIPDPIPKLVDDIQIAAYQLAVDKWNNSNYRVDDNLPEDALKGADERAMILEVAKCLKCRLDGPLSSGEDDIIANFNKRRRANTLPLQTESVLLQDDTSQETLVTDRVHSDDSANTSANTSFESQSGQSSHSAHSSYDDDDNLRTADILSLATGRELRSETRRRSMITPLSVDETEQQNLIALLESIPNLNQVLQDLLARLQSNGYIPREKSSQSGSYHSNPRIISTEHGEHSLLLSAVC
ncbi:uncharacterized protein B0H18DRAFT_960390 [Fomitopsis serialis]|uniref:uncharacterized protein n=1 Tax=Fomitopsis serialis TaxID=139415 RepID=UPI002007736C|nr:uncharacterized protein B0H18DRAFT_960390 [Neoantrodia serialis]KAH9913393.1 hypothetical protein B0H18DRAFT_960390 [Neoantrodia serialis]